VSIRGVEGELLDKATLLSFKILKLMKKKLLIASILILIGIAVGMVISSNLNIFNKAVAQTNQVEQIPQKTLSDITNCPNGNTKCCKYICYKSKEN
jgi:xanthine/uracil permease